MNEPSTLAEAVLSYIHNLERDSRDDALVRREDVANDLRHMAREFADTDPPGPPPEDYD
jgi:hypothetical protein